QFWKWIAEKNSWADVEDNLAELGNKGSRVHKAVEMILTGNPTVAHTSRFTDMLTDQEKELSTEEFECIVGFREYWEAEILPVYTKIQVHAVEKTYTVKGGEGYARGYGCTVDWIFSGEKAGIRELIIVDWKTSKNLYNSHTIQMTGIKKAVVEEGKIPGAENA